MEKLYVGIIHVDIAPISERDSRVLKNRIICEWFYVMLIPAMTAAAQRTNIFFEVEK